MPVAQVLADSSTLDGPRVLLDCGRNSGRHGQTRRGDRRESKTDLKIRDLRIEDYHLCRGRDEVCGLLLSPTPAMQLSE